MLLPARCRFGDSAAFRQVFLFAEDWILLVVDLNVVAGVFAEQDSVTHLHIKRDTAALFDLAGSDGHYFPLMRLLFGRVRDDDAAFRGFLLFQPAYDDAVVQGSDIHSHFFNLRLIHSKDSDTTGEKSSDSSVALLRGHQSLFSYGRFLSEDPLDPPASWIQSQHWLAHPAVSKT